ncbi:MAG: triphosphoribosyl-dephospho-CoA synthase [Gemmataceae bacterium]|nr:triphosphoribosyl-dephospho-CoA synthase [Gemmataceae bacterium]
MKDEKETGRTPSPGVSAAHPGDPDDTIALHAQLACIWEATARKPGNANRTRDLPNLTFIDFLAAGAAIAPAMRHAANRPLGASILEAIRATRSVASTNVNLGIVLLLTPLVATRMGAAKLGSWHECIKKRLAETTIADARDLYGAIRLAEPGGMGKVKDQDVQSEPTVTLLETMKLASERDSIARQYANGFEDVFSRGPLWVREGIAKYGTLEDAVLHTFFHWVAAYPDSLILRKHGEQDAAEASKWGKALSNHGWHDENGRIMKGGFDAWCRDPKRRRNPGTSADLTAASLFVALSVGIIPLPLSIPWSRD